MGFLLLVRTLFHLNLREMKQRIRRTIKTQTTNNICFLFLSLCEHGRCTQKENEPEEEEKIFPKECTVTESGKRDSDPGSDSSDDSDSGM